MSELIEGDEYVMTVRVKVLGVEDDGRVAIRIDGVKRHMTVLAPTEVAAATFTPVPEPVVTYGPGQTVRQKSNGSRVYTIGHGGHYQSPMTNPRDEVAGVLGEHRLNYHHRNVGGDTASELRYTSCEGCDWLGGHHDEAGWEAHLAQVLMPLLKRREREAGARALREMRDEVRAQSGETTALKVALGLVAGMLAHRADAIASGDATTEEAE